jgi:hypothetical protein
VEHCSADFWHGSVEILGAEIDFAVHILASFPDFVIKKRFIKNLDIKKDNDIINPVKNL